MNKISSEIRTYLEKKSQAKEISNLLLGKPRITDNETWQNLEMSNRAQLGLISSVLGGALGHAASGSVPVALLGAALGGLAGSRYGGYDTAMTKKMLKTMEPNTEKITHDSDLLGWTGENKDIADIVKQMQALQFINTPGDVGIGAMLNQISSPISYGVGYLNNEIGKRIPR